MAYNYTKKELQYNTQAGGSQHRYRTYDGSTNPGSWSEWGAWGVQLAKSELDGYRFHLRVTRRAGGELKKEAATLNLKTGVVTVNTTYSSNSGTFNSAGADINIKEIWTTELTNPGWLEDVLCEDQTIVIKAAQSYYHGDGTLLAST